MTQNGSPLLALAKLPSSFRLSEFEFTSPAKEIAFINNEKFDGLDSLEVILDGMAFELNHHTATETSDFFNVRRFSTIFAETPEFDVACLSISLSENLKSGKHIPAVNRALLRLGIFVGDAIQASHMTWLPARQNIDYGYFVTAVDEYLEGGPMPALAQISVNETEKGFFETSGLNYFSGQEVRLSAPQKMSHNEIMKRLFRISHDIASNGKIENVIETSGLVSGETISFEPSKNSHYLNVRITMNAADLLQ